MLWCSCTVAAKSKVESIQDKNGNHRCDQPVEEWKWNKKQKETKVGFHLRE